MIVSGLLPFEEEVTAARLSASFAFHNVQILEAVNNKLSIKTILG